VYISIPFAESNHPAEVSPVGKGSWFKVVALGTKAELSA
jgi:hypothetical protein